MREFQNYVNVDVQSFENIKTYLNTFSARRYGSLVVGYSYNLPSRRYSLDACSEILYHPPETKPFNREDYL